MSCVLFIGFMIFVLISIMIFIIWAMWLNVLVVGFILIMDFILYSSLRMNDFIFMDRMNFRFVMQVNVDTSILITYDVIFDLLTFFIIVFSITSNAINYYIVYLITLCNEL